MLYMKPITLIKKDRFLKNSLIFFIGASLASFGNYVFHFIIARMLSVEDYGKVQSLIALFTIFSVFIVSISTLLIKYTAQLKAKKVLNQISWLFFAFTKKMLILGLVFFAIFSIFSQYAAKFLKLDSGLSVVILGAVFLPSFLNSINIGMLKGLEKFKSASLILIFRVFLKALLAALLVSWGLKVKGVMLALAIGGLATYFVGLLPLSFLFQKKAERLTTAPRLKKDIYQYFFPVFFTLLFLNLFYNIDIILVKHFFSSALAGQYSGLALLGHLIYFWGGPIVGVMFPMAILAKAKNQSPEKVFQKALFLVFILDFLILALYFLFPGLIIKILIGEKFLAAAGLLGWFGLSMLFCGLINLFSQYFLSINQLKPLLVLGIGVLVQIVLICFWHNSLSQIVWIMNIVMLFILAGLSVFYLKTKQNNPLKAY